MRNNHKLIAIIVITVVSLLLIGSGIYFALSRGNQPTDTGSTNTPQPATKPKPAIVDSNPLPVDPANPESNKLHDTLPEDIFITDWELLYNTIQPLSAAEFVYENIVEYTTSTTGETQIRLNILDDKIDKVGGGYEFMIQRDDTLEELFYVRVTPTADNEYKVDFY